MLCTDMLAPQEHLLRKIDAAVDFTHIYKLVEDLYCENNGRPSCDPEVLFKLVLIQHLFGIQSLRQTMRDAEVNVTYRWFLGYTENQQCIKTVARHIWHDYIERAEDVRHSPVGKKTYALRSQTIERVFADAKEKHAMRYTPYRELPAVTAWFKTV